jgi:hypothetical protein
VRVKEIGSRVTIEHSIGGPAVRIRAPRNWGALIFLPIWLAGWTFGGVLAIGAFFREPRLFLGVWLIGWLAGEAFAILAWSWAAFGEEVLTLGEGSLSLAKRIGPFQRLRRYPLHNSSNVRAAGWFASPTSFADSLRPWGLTGGTVAFDHHGKSVRFGIGLPEHEARQVAAELAPYMREAA